MRSWLRGRSKGAPSHAVPDLLFADEPIKFSRMDC